MTYKEARENAQRCANETGFDYGVEQNAFGYTYYMLPKRQNRYGNELRCEVVYCEDLARVQAGHGPEARAR